MTQFDKDLDRIGRAGQAAWAQLKKSKDWGFWLVVGESLAAGRTMAMQGAGTNKPEGRGYNELFSQWLNRYRLSEIDKVTRSHLLIVMQNRIEIEEYRKSLPLSERMRLNHPTVMLRHWKKATAVKKQTRATPNVPDETEALKAHIHELEAAREVTKPLALAGAREQYLSHLMRMTRHQWMNEIKQIWFELTGEDGGYLDQAKATEAERREARNADR